MFAFLKQILKIQLLTFVIMVFSVEVCAEDPTIPMEMQNLMQRHLLKRGNSAMFAVLKKNPDLYSAIGFLSVCDRKREADRIFGEIASGEDVFYVNVVEGFEGKPFRKWREVEKAYFRTLAKISYAQRVSGLMIGQSRILQRLLEERPELKDVVCELGPEFLNRYQRMNGEMPGE